MRLARSAAGRTRRPARLRPRTRFRPQRERPPEWRAARPPTDTANVAESSRLPNPFLETSNLEQQPLGIFDRLLDAHQELHSLGPVDDPMVVAEREVHHGADGDLAAGGGEFGRAALDCVHAEDGG